MEHIYIAMVDTPGLFAYLIRRFLKQKYIHVVISMDAQLNEAYSYGRRNARIPFYQKNHYTCSSYIARLPRANQIGISPKHFSLVTPKDFYLYSGKKIVFEGRLAEFVAIQ